MDREREKHYSKHHIERLLPNSFGLSNTVEGESGYCGDHLEMREKDAGVLTEDKGRFGGNSRTHSPVFGPEHPPKWMRSSPPISVTVRHHQGLEDNIGANTASGFTTEHKRHLTLSYRDIRSTASSEETPSCPAYNTSRPAPIGFVQHSEPLKEPSYFVFYYKRFITPFVSPHTK